MVFICLSTLLNCIAQQPSGINTMPLTIFDKEKSYPLIEHFKPEMEELCIPLETSDDILIGQGAHVYYVSDQKILIANELQGDVHIFDMNGKALSHFNQKGGYGYHFITYAVYDEANQEIYILDDLKKKVFVFTEAGSLKRTLRLSSNMSIKEIHNFNENYLLAFHEHKFGPVNVKKPYMFISKKNGSMKSRLNIRTDNATPTILVSEKQWISVGHVDCTGSCKFGDEYILHNMSCDTIYLLNKDKSLRPLFVQTPSVFSKPSIITSVTMKTDNFMIFSTYTHDLDKAKEKLKKGINGNNTKEPQFIYDFSTQEISELKDWESWVEKVDVPKNTGVRMYEIWKLKKLLELGRLDGRLKELAQNLNEEDNPVIRIVKFK